MKNEEYDYFYLQLFKIMIDKKKEKFDLNALFKIFEEHLDNKIFFT